MKNLKKNICFSGLLALFALSSQAQETLVTSIEMPDNKVYDMVYGADNILFLVSCREANSSKAQSSITILHPNDSGIISEYRVFDADGNSTTVSRDEVLIFKKWKLYHVDRTEHASEGDTYIVDRAGVQMPGDSKDITFEWSGNSLSKMVTERAEYKFKYSRHSFLLSNPHSRDWFCFILNKILTPDFFSFWYVGMIYPFEKYPSEIIYKSINGEEKKLAFNYKWLPNGSLLIDYEWIINRHSLGHKFIKVNFETIQLY